MLAQPLTAPLVEGLAPIVFAGGAFFGFRASLLLFI